MANQNFDNVQTNQIAMYQNDKKLIEFVDKLNPAPVIRYARLHAQGEDGPDGKKIYSKIGAVLLDYTEHNADRSKPTKRVTANFDPEEIRYFFDYIAHKCVPGNDTFEYTSDKIIGAVKDSEGKSPVTKCRILRQPTRKDQSGNIVKSKYPWYIEVTNGKATPVPTSIGGCYYKNDTFVQIEKIFVNLTDYDWYSLLSRVVSYINVFEQCYGSSLIVAAYNNRINQSDIPHNA